MTAALGAADRAFWLIELQPKVPLEEADAVPMPENLKGQLEFSNCRFVYPSRPDRVVLQDLTLSVAAGSTVALVGPSGQGKSTIIALAERFYVPEQGGLTLDGERIGRYTHESYHR